MEKPNERNRMTFRVISGILGLYIFIRWLLFPLLPFLLALAVSALTEPTVRGLQRIMKVRRSFAAVVIMTLLLMIIGSGAVLLLLRLTGEVSDALRKLPSALEQFPSLWNGVLEKIAFWYEDTPHFIRISLDALAAYLAEQAPVILSSAGENLISWFSKTASALPEAGLFLITCVLALYFCSLNYPAILGFFKRQLPPVWQKKCRKLALCCRSTLLKWLRSEVILICTTFLILLITFLWVGVDYAFLAAMLIALVDALPVLGSGVVLLPWAACAALLGNTERGLLLLFLYAFITVIHAILEPRLLAGQAELPAISALFSMYLGFQLFGVKGMVLLPFLLLLAKQLQDADIIHIWQ